MLNRFKVIFPVFQVFNPEEEEEKEEQNPKTLRSLKVHDSLLVGLFWSYEKMVWQLAALGNIHGQESNTRRVQF